MKIIQIRSGKWILKVRGKAVGRDYGEWLCDSAIVRWCLFDSKEELELHFKHFIALNVKPIQTIKVN